MLPAVTTARQQVAVTTARRQIRPSLSWYWLMIGLMHGYLLKYFVLQWEHAWIQSTTLSLSSFNGFQPSNFGRSSCGCERISSLCSIPGISSSCLRTVPQVSADLIHLSQCRCDVASEVLLSLSIVLRVARSSIVRAIHSIRIKGSMSVMLPVSEYHPLRRHFVRVFLLEIVTVLRRAYHNQFLCTLSGDLTSSRERQSTQFQGARAREHLPARACQDLVDES